MKALWNPTLRTVEGLKWCMTTGTKNSSRPPSCGTLIRRRTSIFSLEPPLDDQESLGGGGEEGGTEGERERERKRINKRNLINFRTNKKKTLEAASGFCRNDNSNFLSLFLSLSRTLSRALPLALPLALSLACALSRSLSLSFRSTPGRQVQRCVYWYFFSNHYRVGSKKAQLPSFPRHGRGLHAFINPKTNERV